MFLGVPILGIVAAIWRSFIAVMSDRATANALQGTVGLPQGSDPPDDPPPMVEGPLVSPAEPT